MKETTEVLDYRQGANSQTRQVSAVPARLRSITRRGLGVLTPDLISTTGLSGQGQAQSSPPGQRSLRDPGESQPTSPDDKEVAD